jgi:hypothetical protein
MDLEQGQLAFARARGNFKRGNERPVHKSPGNSKPVSTLTVRLRSHANKLKC